MNFRWLRNISLALLLLIVAVGGSYYALKDNIHTVIPGEVYRSAELTPQQFATLIQEKGIRTIINLRGPAPHQSWYQAEVATSEALRVQHLDISLRAYRLPDTATLKQLINLLNTAPRPLLLHCEGGADRSGFASAITLILQGKPLAEAEQQYSWRYLVIYPHSVGKLFFPRYENWLEQQGLTHNKARFLQFIAESKP